MIRFCLTLLALVSIVSPLFAQPPGAAVRGEVRDPSGAVVTGATITLAQTSTNLVRTATTAADGQYVIPSLPPGRYRLEVAQAGFKTYVETFELFVSQDLRVDVGAAGGRAVRAGARRGPGHRPRARQRRGEHCRRQRARREPAARRAQFPRARLAVARHGARRRRGRPVRCAAISRSPRPAAARTPTGSCSTAWTTSTRS